MPGTRSALIVATDAYEDRKLQKLRAPAEDAEALAHVLRDPKIGDFDVTFSINAKEYELRRTISSFFADRSPEDVLLLHFGCHGLKDDDGHLYFAASDTEFAHLDATAVPAEFVNRRMNESRSRRIILFLDCCYSGAFASGMTARAGETVEIRERFEGTGRVVLTASNAMEYSFEGENRHGRGHESVFTSALVQGLRSGEADRDQDRWISVDELYDYVFEHVRETTPHQTPGKWSFVQGDVYIARSSYVAPVERLDLPPELRSMESSVLPSTREQLVAELQRLIATRPQFAYAATESLVRLRDDDSRRVAAAAERALAARDNENGAAAVIRPAHAADATPREDVIRPADAAGSSTREAGSTGTPPLEMSERRDAPAQPNPIPADVEATAGRSKLAMAALVCAALSFYTYGLSGIAAIVLGINAEKEIAATPGKSGAWMATAAIVLGVGGIIFWIVRAIVLTSS